MYWGPAGSSVRGIFLARTLEWAAISFSMGFSQPRDLTHISHLAGRFFTTELPGKSILASWYPKCKTFFFFLQNIFQWKHNWTENQRSFHWVHCIFVVNFVFFPSASVMFRPILRWMCVCVQSCPNLCDPIDYSPPGCSVHGIVQARMLEWVAISSCWGSSWSRDQNCISCIFCIAGRFFIAEPLRSPISFFLSSVQFVAQLCPTLCNPMNHSMPDLPVHHQLPE